MRFSKKKQANEELARRLLERKRATSAEIDELGTRISVLDAAVTEQLHFVASLYERGAINATQKNELEHQIKLRVTEQLAEIQPRLPALQTELNTLETSLRTIVEAERRTIKRLKILRGGVQVVNIAMKIVNIAMKMLGSSGDTKT